VPAEFKRARLHDFVEGSKVAVLFKGRKNHPRPLQQVLEGSHFGASLDTCR